jgi:gliding motility-associated-like protein
MRLFIDQKPHVAVGPDTEVCDNQQHIPLTYTSSTSAMQWTSSGSGTFLPTSAPWATHYQLSEADKKSAVLTLRLGQHSSGPCGYTGAPMQVRVKKSPRADFVASSYQLEKPGEQIKFTNTSSPADMYAWNFGDGATSATLHPTHVFTEPGYYQVTLHATNNNGCDDIVGKVITVLGDVQVPNAFTPNTEGASGGRYNKYDNSNDVFFPFARGVVLYHMSIFNRYGELIFQSNDIDIGWDGYFNGKLCQQDTYVWQIDLRFFPI